MENYTHKLPTSAKRLAIRQALTLAAEGGKVVVLEALELKGKTAEAAKLLDKIGAVKNTLVVVENKTPELVRALNNLGNVKVVQARYVNVFDVLNADHVVVTNGALAVVNEWLGGKA